MIRTTHILFLLFLLAYQGSTQIKKQQTPGNTANKTKGQIGSLTPTSAPPSFPPSATNALSGIIGTPNTNSQQTSDQNNGETKWEHSITFFNVLSTAIIAIFTVLAWMVYKQQLKTAKINERAWIVPVIGIIEPTTDKNIFQIRVDLRNNGKTPAWITAAGSRGRGVTETSPLPDKPPYQDMGPFSKKGSLLMPTGAFTQGFSLEQERLDSVLNKQSQLFIFGYVKYRDVYEKPHIVRYCFEAKKSQDANHPHPLEFYVGGPDHYMEAD